MSGGETETQVEQLERERQQIRLTMEISRFRLPPVESALVIGRRASIGPKAMEKALSEMMPGVFETIAVEHPVIEAILLRSVHLRRLSAAKLVPVIVRKCENLMDDTDMLHFELDIRVRTTEEIEL